MILSRFIKKTLQEEGERFLRRQTGRIVSKTSERTGNLLRDRRISVYGSNGDFDAMMTFTHPIYERFLDMRQLSNRSKGRRRDIHNRLVFSMYGRIADRLMNGFTQEVQNTLGKEIDAIRQSFLK